MQIQPLEPVNIILTNGDIQAKCILVELTDEDMILKSKDFLDKDQSVRFKSKYFKGEALIASISYSQNKFTYTLQINHISYQPGLLVNTKL